MPGVSWVFDPKLGFIYGDSSLEESEGVWGKEPGDESICVEFDGVN